LKKENIKRIVRAQLEFEKESSKLTEIIKNIIHEGTAKFIDSFNSYVDNSVSDPMIKKVLDLLEQEIRPIDIADKLKRSRAWASGVFRKIMKVIEDFANYTNDPEIENFVQDKLKA